MLRQPEIRCQGGPRRTLTPFDGSPASDAALLELLKIAKQEVYEVLLLHVIRLPTTENYSDGTVGAILLDPVRKAGKNLLNVARAKLAGQGISVAVDLVESHSENVADQVVERAAAWHADLIVVGTNARHSLPRFIMGSHAADIVRPFPVPVLLVRSSRAT